MLGELAMILLKRDAFLVVLLLISDPAITLDHSPQLRNNTRYHVKTVYLPRSINTSTLYNATRLHQ